MSCAFGDIPISRKSRTASRFPSATALRKASLVYSYPTFPRATFLSPPAEGRVIRGEAGMDVGERVHVKLVAQVGVGTVAAGVAKAHADVVRRFVQRDANNALTVTSSFVNLSEDIVKGYEFNGRYARDMFGGRFTFNANVTKYTEQSSRLFPEEFLTDANGIVTVPEWVGNFDATFGTKNVTFRYGVDWIGGDRHDTYNYFAFDNLTGITDPADVQFNRDNYYLETPNYFLHNASIQFDVAKYEFTLGVRNLFDKAPPRISNVGFNTIGNAPLYSGYDYRGRTFFANANFKF